GRRGERGCKHKHDGSTLAIRYPCVRRRALISSRALSRGNSASEQETAVPPRSANETRTPHTPLSDEFVSAKKSLQRKSRKGPETCQASSAPAIPSRRGEKCSRRTIPTNTIGMLRVCRRSAPKIGESYNRNRTGAKLSSSVTADCTRSAPIVPQR